MNTVSRDSGIIKLFGKEMQDGDTDTKEKNGVVYDVNNFHGYLTFVSQLIWLLVGTLFAGTVVSLLWLFHGCPFDSSIDSLSILALGISIGLYAGAFYFPLFYLGGEERNEVFLVIGLLCTAGIVLGITCVINFYLDPGLTTVLLGAAVLTVCSLLAFILSYPLTGSIYSKKDY